jgi:hypothetical protein
MRLGNDNTPVKGCWPENISPHQGSPCELKTACIQLHSSIFHVSSHQTGKSMPKNRENVIKNNCHFVISNTFIR